MKFISLILEVKGNRKRFDFCLKNQIYSSKNSVGKSTLTRLLFYSLGYPVPGTKKFNFNNCITRISFRRNSDIIEMERDGNLIKTVVNKIDFKHFIVPQQELELLSFVWGSKNREVLKNIIGAIYFDQEKGWTLLNRGKVIGNIQFNIDELIRGLSSTDVSELSIEKNSIEAEIRKYEYLKNILEYKNQISNSESKHLYMNRSEELYTRLSQFEIERKAIVKEIQSIKVAAKDNESFLKYIESMKIYVKNPDSLSDEIIPVSKSTILYFHETQEYLETQLKIEQINLANKDQEIKKMHFQLQEYGAQLNVQTEIERFNQNVLSLNFDYTRVDKIIHDLKKSKSKIEKDIKEITLSNNELISKIQRTINDYLVRLEAVEYINANSNFLFTSDLKSLSGAVLHKLVFAYKMAYVKSIENYLNVRLPIVLDSPTGRELNSENIDKMFDIIKSDFSENQIIIASIHSKVLDDDKKVIQINEYLMENASSLLTVDKEN
ncbi:hypothetical protein [Exiguobacterium mexicanum]|uniref:hypothetical protein n=1 Tax=Exiguobacterium mexicanum TaxID=340146 RepID=UPI00110F639D|nr:hypothetical protein [Exiguobacterium mexicanum]